MRVVAKRPGQRAMIAASPGRGPVSTRPCSSTLAIGLSFDWNAARCVTSSSEPSESFAVTMSCCRVRGRIRRAFGVTRIDSTGISTPIGFGFTTVYGMDFGPDGRLYLTEFDNDRVLVVSIPRPALPIAELPAIGVPAIGVLIASLLGVGGVALARRH